MTNLDSSQITYMGCLFCDSEEFNQDICNWDVRNVITAQRMFYESQFNQDVSNWDLKNCVNGHEIFSDSAMNYSGMSYKYFKIEPARNADEYNVALNAWQRSG